MDLGKELVIRRDFARQNIVLMCMEHVFGLHIRVGILPDIGNSLPATDNKLHVSHLQSRTVSPSGLIVMQCSGVLSSGHYELVQQPRADHLKAECARDNVPDADKTTLIDHDDLFLQIATRRKYHLVRMQHTTVDRSS